MIILKVLDWLTFVMMTQLLPLQKLKMVHLKKKME
jgi:hypothetical protein